MARKQPTGDYGVGFARPPKETRFKLGQSGNPTGARKGSTSLWPEIDKQLRHRVTITDDKGKRRVTMFELIAKRLVTMAAKGDPKAIMFLLNRADRQDPGVDDANRGYTDAETRVLEDMLTQCQLDDSEDKGGE